MRTPAWVKFGIWLGGIVVITAITLIPEAILYEIWQIVSPTTEGGKVLMAFLCLWVGGGISTLFLIIGLMCMVGWTATAVDL